MKPVHQGTQALPSKSAAGGTLAGALGAVYLFGLLGADEEAAWTSGWEPIVLGEQPDPDIDQTDPTNAGR